MRFPKLFGAMVLAPALYAQSTHGDVSVARRAVTASRSPTLAQGAARTLTAVSAPPAVTREFRAVWVATVGNIDWPSKPGLSTWDQQRELLAILDRSVALGLNAVIFQIRPGADALYA